MNKQSVEIMDEFRDDIQLVCEALIEAREELEKKDEEIENLKYEAHNHECTTE